MTGLPNMAHKSSDKLDYMSQLPDAILQHILFFLPIQDAARASILSKTCLRVWKSLPLFTFSFDKHQLGMPILDFVTWVNQSLSPLQNHKAIIQSFRLNMSLSQDQKDFVSDIDKWICLVMRNCVRELYISISCPSNILLPEATFTSKSLVVLHLYGCKLPATLFANSVTFNCLKELHLWHVVANEDQIQNIISAFPSLERLTLILEEVMKCLVLDNFLMLHFLFATVRILKLDAVNLHTLIFLGLNELHTSNSTVNIKDLHCHFSYSLNPNNLLHEIVSRFPLLEHLHLSLANGIRFRIQHCHLQTLSLSLHGIPQDPNEVEIEAPNICQFFCASDLFPSLRVTSTSIKECESLQLYIQPIDLNLDGFQIHQLGNFLQNFNPNIDVNLHNLHTENFLTLEQLQEENVISCPSKVRKLVLSSVSASSDYTSFLDGLLWTCHPTTLLIEKCLVNSHNFIKFLCRELLGRKENPTCCRENLKKCWRHFLKDVEVKCYKRLCEPEKLICLVSSNLSTTLSMCDTGKSVEFRFEWLRDPLCSSFQDL